MNSLQPLGKKPKITAMYLAKTAILSVISFILYTFVKFPLPFMFPSFLDMHFSELPALLAGFSMGPVSGCLVILIRCLLKLPMSSTGFVGEFTDLVLGVAIVLPASLIYKYHKNIKSAILGLSAGVVSSVIVGIILNRFVSIPFYVAFFFGGNWDILLNMVRPLYPGVTRDNFYFYYLLLAVAPFNIIRSSVMALLTFLLYKKLSKLLHWEKHKTPKEPNKLPMEKE
ncbi:MAG: ECF transporter S component [Bacillota bacterium]